MKQNIIFGLHPVESLLESHLKIQEIYILKDIKKNKIETVLNLASEKGIPVQYVEKRQTLDELCFGENHQGVAASIKSDVSYRHLQEFKDAKLLLMLDHITDPHNFGAILRSADQFNIDAVIIPKNRSIEITPSVIRSSSGAAFFVPVIREANLTQSLNKLKEWGFWSYAAAGGEGQSLAQTEFDSKTVIVMGSEGSGLSQNLKKNCDFSIQIPSNGKIESLNVSVATAIFLYKAAIDLKTVE